MMRRKKASGVQVKVTNKRQPHTFILSQRMIAESSIYLSIFFKYYCPSATKLGQYVRLKVQVQVPELDPRSQKDPRSILNLELRFEF